MNIILVDDEIAARHLLEEEICSLYPLAHVESFFVPFQALDRAQKMQVDVAFLDIEMPQMNGIELAKELRKQNPHCNVIFTTAYREYGLDALQLHASGYILKPVSREAVQREMSALRYPVREIMSEIVARTFGEFELFVDGKPLPFGRMKAKEMLAYLIQRQGNGVSKKELASVLFEDREYDRSAQDYFHKIERELEHALAEGNASRMYTRDHNYYAVRIEEFTCDLYDFEKGDADAMRQYQGAYMSQYSWGEEYMVRMLENKQ